MSALQASYVNIYVTRRRTEKYMKNKNDPGWTRSSTPGRTVISHCSKGMVQKVKLRLAANEPHPLSPDTVAVLENVDPAVSAGCREQPASQPSSTCRCRHSVLSPALHSSHGLHSETGIASVEMQAPKVLASPCT